MSDEVKTSRFLIHHSSFLLHHSLPVFCVPAVNYYFVPIQLAREQKLRKVRRVDKPCGAGEDAARFRGRHFIREKIHGAHGIRTFKVAARKLSATTARPNLQ
jgi:hypothetical protein